MINKVILIGNLTASPELKTTTTGLNYARFCIAINSKSKNGEHTDFINVVAWNNTAGFICKYFTKGQKIFIDGRIQTSKYTQDDKTYTSTEIVAQSVDFVGNKKSNEINNQEDLKTNIQNTELTEDNDLPF